MLADEDDCSMAHSTLLGSDTNTLGPLQSFRCTRFGVTCDTGGVTPDQMNQVGPKSGCHPNEASAYLTSIAGYTTFLQGLKTDPRTVMFGAIVGDPAPVAVELTTPPGGGTAIPALAHSCTWQTSAGSPVADPGVRLAALARSFARNDVETVCEADLSGALANLARQVKGLVGDPCLQRAIAMSADCQVFDQRATGPEVPVPACDASVTTDCFTLKTDPVACPDAQHLLLDVTRAATPPPDTMTGVRCVL